MFSKKAVFAVGFMLFAASMACSNPITDYFSTRTAVMQTATATMWTPTPTNTPTSTPTNTPTNTPTDTPSPTPDARYYETGGTADFSYVPPKKWKKNTGEDLMAWTGPGDTMLYFYSDKSNYDASELADLLISYYKSQYGATCDNEGSFDTDAGLDSAWITCIVSVQGGELQVREFLFSDGSGHIVEATYLRVDGQDEDQDPVVEDCLKTLRFD